MSSTSAPFDERFTRTTALYTASATSWGGRTGKVVTSDDKLSLDLSIPAEMGGDGGAGTNPE